VAVVRRWDVGASGGYAGWKHEWWGAMRWWGNDGGC
jgi:hypothetical protein